MRQPVVIKGAAAAMALRQGALEHHDPEMHNTTYEAAMLALRAFGTWEAERLRDGAQ